MEKEKNQELEKILSELNTNMRNPSKEDEPAAQQEVRRERKPRKNSREAPDKESSRSPSPKGGEQVKEEKSSATAVPENTGNLEAGKQPTKKAVAGNKPAVKSVEVLAEKSVAQDVPDSAEKTEPVGEGKKPRPPKEAGQRNGERKLREKLEETAEAAEGFFREEKGSFLESARIIEEEMSERELKKTAVRHIAVTAAEVVTDSVTEEPATPRQAFDQQKQPAEAGGEPPHFPRRTRKRMNKRERATAILGVLVTIFVLIGIVSTIFVTVNVTRELVNATSKKEELAKVIFPLVIVDIPEFDTPESLDNSAIIQSSIWAFIIDEEDKSKYPKDDLGAMTVPETDIEPYIRRLYGNDVKIAHQSIDDASVQMLYDSENKRYIIESTPRFLPYTPRVDQISKSGDIYTLRVSYVLPDAMWNLQKDHSGATVDKVMEYQLKKNKDSYQMLSVKLLEVTGRSEQGSGTSSQAATPIEPSLDEILSPSSELAGSASENGSETSDGEAVSGEASSTDTESQIGTDTEAQSQTEDDGTLAD